MKKYLYYQHVYSKMLERANELKMHVFSEVEKTKESNQKLEKVEKEMENTIIVTC